MASHLSQRGVNKGRLSRNASHRKNARDAVKATGFYDDTATIRAGLKKAGTKAKRGWREVDHYKFDYKRRLRKKNFAGGTYPYRNQSHHMLPCEVFYHKKWTRSHLALIRGAGYNINHEDNIIYLPQCSGQLHLSYFHDLPDHSKGHSDYNEHMVRKANKLFNIVDKEAKKPCNKRKDIADDILAELEELEIHAYNALAGAGATPIGDVF